MVTETQLYKVEVTQEDIDKGISYMDTTTKCPVARAMKRATGTVVNVGVLAANMKNRSVVFFLPEEVGTKIVKLSKGEAVEPFNFEVRGNIYE